MYFGGLGGDRWSRRRQSRRETPGWQCSSRSHQTEHHRIGGAARQHEPVTQDTLPQRTDLLRHPLTPHVSNREKYSRRMRSVSRKARSATRPTAGRRDARSHRGGPDPEPHLREPIGLVDLIDATATQEPPLVPNRKRVGLALLGKLLLGCYPRTSVLERIFRMTLPIQGEISAADERPDACAPRRPADRDGWHKRSRACSSRQHHCCPATTSARHCRGLWWADVIADLVRLIVVRRCVGRPLSQSRPVTPGDQRPWQAAGRRLAHQSPRMREPCRQNCPHTVPRSANGTRQRPQEARRSERRR